MPVGYLVTVALAALCTFLAVRPLWRPAAAADVSFRVGLLVNELPFLVFYYLLASTLLAVGQGDVDSAGGWFTLALAALATAGLVVIVRRALRTGRVAERAVGDGLGVALPHRRPPWARILFRPLFMRRRDVERVSNMRYGNAGTRNELDVYRHRSRPSGCPTLIHLHGGHFVRGRKSRESLPLIYRLATQGWVCISANYRLSPEVAFPEHLIDAKRVIAWIREHGGEYGADPAAVFITGSSAGGHIAAMAALTPNDPAFQPGFEHADTTVAAAVCLGAYLGPVASGDPSSSPIDHARPDAPPFLVAHGDRDTVVRVEGARSFVARLRTTSRQPVVYLELPGAQHAFDLFHSIRFEKVVDTIEAFAAAVSPVRAEARPRS
jgi:acetyl esterase/lipase